MKKRTKMSCGKAVRIVKLSVHLLSVHSMNWGVMGVALSIVAVRDDDDGVGNGGRVEDRVLLGENDTYAKCVFSGNQNSAS